MATDTLDLRDAVAVARSGRDRRLRSARIARLLLPAAITLGGYSSAELLVRPPGGGGELWRPDAAVALGEPPADGVLDGAPALVVLLGPPAPPPARWLAATARAVWELRDRGARLHLPDGTTEAVRAPGELTVPDLPALRLPVALLAR